MKQITGLPIGSERLQWDRNMLAEKDRTVERINAEWRDRIFVRVGRSSCSQSSVNVYGF